MDESTSIQEIIDGEIQFMKSAFSDEFEDLRSDEESSLPPTVQLKLGPLHTQGGTLHTHIHVILQIKTNSNYPYEPASTSIKSYEGVSSQECEELLEQLKNIAEEHSKTGNVVMHELCHHTQTYLSEHARPYSESIYAEMIAGLKARKEAIQEEAQRTLQLEEERQIRLFEEERVRVQKSLKEEARQRKERHKHPSTVAENLQNLSSSEDELEHSQESNKNRSQSSETSLKEKKSIEVLALGVVAFPLSGKRERHIVLQESLGQRPSQGCHILLGQDQESNDHFVVYDWFMESKKKKKNRSSIDNRMEELINKITSIDKEMNLLLKLEHKNLVHFRGMKVLRPHVNSVKVLLLQEYVHGLSLSYYLNHNIPQSEAFLQLVSSGVLNALAYLHQNNVVHRNLRDSCIYVDQKSQTVRLADFGIEFRCAEIFSEFNCADLSYSYPSSPGRGNKKCDIFRFGIIILSLYVGKRINEIGPSIPSDTPSDLKSFLNHSLQFNEHERWSVSKLLHHPFISQNGPKLSPTASDEIDEGSQEGSSSKDSDDVVASSSVPIHLPSNLRGYSRFASEYVLEEFLGKGGFGRVYKVRNKVDDRLYALKQISLHHQSESRQRKITREVKLLSSLNHENVVRYYTSWIECLMEPEDKEGEDSVDCSTSPNTGGSEEFDSFQQDSDDSEGIDDGLGENEGQEGDWILSSLKSVLHGNNDQEDSDDILFVDSHSQQVRTFPPEGGDPVSSSKEGLAQKPKESNQPKKYQFLYIQMQFCAKRTLRNAIDDNHIHIDEVRYWRLFREILNGLHYIHLQGLIHRDLKPGNIFLDSNDHVKIGDFGLATVALKSKGMPANIPTLAAKEEETKDSTAYTGHVGTTFYIAPEVKATSKASYSRKVDLFSLGIIFFEMVYPPLKTAMEREKVLSEIRRSIFPSDFDFDGKRTQGDLIRWLLSVHTQRPTTSDLLESSLLPPPPAQERKFMSDLEARIKNHESAQFQNILSFLFKPSARPQLEATFEWNIPKPSHKNYYATDVIKMSIAHIFRNHGAIWIPTPFYAPKGSFYLDKENLVTLLSKGGELISAQYELRYPFARLVAKSYIRRLRRFNIDRVQRAHQTSGIHPREIYECAFDIIAPKQDSSESFARVLLAAQDVLQKVANVSPCEVTLKIGHTDLFNQIISSYNLPKDDITKQFSGFQGNKQALEEICECLEASLSPQSIMSLKSLAMVEGKPDDIYHTLSNKRIEIQGRHSGLKDVFLQINDLIHTARVMGVKFEMMVRPLMVQDLSLYQGIYFQLTPLIASKTSFNILAQGGSFEHLIHHHRKRILLSQKRPESSNLSAVGVSLPFDRFVNKSEDISARISKFEANCISSRLNPHSDLYICSVGKKRLKERTELSKKILASSIHVDHCYVSDMTEAESLCEDVYHASHFLFLMPSGKRIHRFIDRSNEKYGPTDKMLSSDSDLQDLLKSLRPGVQEQPIKLTSSNGSYSSSSHRRDSSKAPPINHSEDFEVNFTYINRKAMKIKDGSKFELQIKEEIKSSLNSRWSNVSSNTAVDVLVVNLLRKIVLTFGQLDVDSNAKNFNDSVAEIKSRFPESREDIEEVCQKLQKMFFYSKKSSRPLILIYSISSETLKRLL